MSVDPLDVAELRRRAEEQARSSDDVSLLDEADVRKTLHELRVHEIELELQNEELRRTRKQYEDLYDFAPVGYYTLQRDGSIVQTNVMGAGQLRQPRDEVVGRSLTEFVPVESRRAVGVLLSEVFDSGLGSTELVLVPAGGAPPLTVSVEAVRSPDAETAVAVTVDVTARRRAQRDQALLAARAGETERAEMVAQLAGGVAHDLNNLLTVVLGYAELVAADHPDSEPGSAIRQITDAARRAAQITGQLLAFGRRQVLMPEEVDVVAFLHESRALVRAIVGEQAAVEIAPAQGNGLWILIDPNQLTQILLNLAANARDAMPDGGVLRIEARMLAIDERERIDGVHGSVPAGEYVCVTVADQGIGIEPALLGRVTEPFFTTKPHGAGSGLGLAAVDGIVVQSGAHWLVDSTVGVGTRFTFLFPVSNGSMGTARRARESASVGGGAHEARGPTPPSQPMVVLVVDDEQQLRSLCEQALRRAGYEVVLARSGEEALERLAESAVAVVVSDIAMTGMDGIELAGRAREAHPGLPFVFMSGYPYERAVAAGLGNHDVFLQKPFTLEALVAVVGRLTAARPPDTVA